MLQHSTRSRVAFPKLGWAHQSISVISQWEFTDYIPESELVDVTNVYESVWNPHYVYLIDDLEKVQKQATKILRQCRHLNYWRLLKFWSGI